MTTVTAPRINMRLSCQDDAVIRRAAEISGSTVTDFVVTSALLAAERKLAEQRVWRLDAAAWDKFSTSLNAKPTEKHRAKVAALFARAGATADFADE